MAERITVTPVEAAVTLVNELFGDPNVYPQSEWSKRNPNSGHYSPEIARALHGEKWKEWFHPEGNSVKPASFLQDTQRSQLLIDTVNRVIEMIPANKGSRNLEMTLEREKGYFRRRLGLDDGRFHTNEEIGKEWGVTFERARQIGAKALRKLRYQAIHSGALDQFLP